MFFHGNNNDIIKSIEAIGAGFAVYEYVNNSNNFILISSNTIYEDITGKDKSETLNKLINIVFPRYISQPLYDVFIQCKTEQVAIESEILIDYKGVERFWRSIVSPILEEANGKLRIIQTCVEITDKKLLEKKLNLSMKRFEAVVQSAYDGIITINTEQNICLVNEAAEMIFGYSEKEILNEHLTKLIPQTHRKKHPEYVHGFQTSSVDSRPMQTRASVRGLRKDGTEFPIEVTISKISIENNIEMTAVIRDISEKNMLLEELLISSREDSLTKLNNRRHFTELLSSEINIFKRFGRVFSLVMLDIDLFKKLMIHMAMNVGIKLYYI